MNDDEIVREWGLSDGVHRGLLDRVNPTFGTDWETEEERRKEVFSKLPEFAAKISEQLKQRFRFGIPHAQRRKWWLVATGGLQLLQEYGDVWPAASSDADKTPQTDISQFGGGINLLSFLKPDVAEQCKAFLHVIWLRNKQIDFSPLIPTVSVLLLLYMEPPLAYLSIQAMINRSTQDSWYFTLSRDKFLASVEAFRDLIHNKCRNIENKCIQLGLDIAQIGLALFPVFFLPFTPLPVALTLFDSFAFEGRKILIRFALCLFLQEEKRLISAASAKDFLMVLVRGMDQLTSVHSTSSFLTRSFGIFLSRDRHIIKYENSAIKEKRGVVSSSLCKSASCFKEMVSSEISEVFVKTRRHSDTSFESDDDLVTVDRSKSCSLTIATLQKFTPEEMEAQQKNLQRSIAESAAPNVVGGRLLTPDLFYSLRSIFPISIRSYCAKIVFSLTNDGTTFLSIFQNTQRRTPYILLIKTTRRTIGALIGDPINPDFSHKGRYYGKPYTFVFTCDPLKIHRRDPPGNLMFQSTTSSTISIGGPRPAIFIEKSFSTLISEQCDTFGSPSFVDTPEGDTILETEVYQLSIPV